MATATQRADATGKLHGSSPERQHATEEDLCRTQNPLASGAKAVWLDCDPGHDDAIALLMTLFAPSHERSSTPTQGADASALPAAIALLGVSAVGGNAPVSATFANAARLLEYFGAPLPSGPGDFSSGGVHLLMGAADPMVKAPRCDPAIHGEDGLGGVTGLPLLGSPAVQKRVWASYGHHPAGETLPRPSPSALLLHWSQHLQYRIAHKLPKVTIVATGPLTNVALLIKAFPELVEEGVQEIVIMGGVEGQRGNRGPLAEFNILVDPEAASIVFNHDIKVVMAGLNVTHQAIFTPELLQTLLTPQTGQEANHEFRKAIASILTFFAQTYASEFGFTEGPPVHDVLAVAYVVDPTLFHRRDTVTGRKNIKPPRYNVQVECSENSLALGATVADVFSRKDDFPVTYWGRGGRNVEVLDVLDVASLWQLFFACIERFEMLN